MSAVTAAAEIKYPKKGDTCQVDSDCYEPWEVCSSNLCAHKNLAPVAGLEWFGFIWTAVWLLVCNIGGVGGAGTLIPFLRLIFNFNVVDAIALSNITIFVSGFIRWVWDAKKRHPQKKNADGKPFATLVDYSVAVMILPLGVTGAALGSMVSLVLPEPILVAIMTVTLFAIAVNIGFKLKSMYDAENQIKKTRETEMTKVKEPGSAKTAV